MPATPAAAVVAAPAAPAAGLLIVNADDWGRDRHTTDTILDCIQRGGVSSTSAMVFMEDSERAAQIAGDRSVDAGLHLNLTTPFSASRVPAPLVERQRRLISYLRRHRLAQVVFHPGLARSFEYVVSAQLDEFRRLYGGAPQRVDGHHHMHLCANVLVQKLLPAGTLARRSFSFQAGEKGRINRLYRRWLDATLGRRHQLVDYLFALPPLDDAARLNRIVALARQSVVELETHPVNGAEYRFLTNGDFIRRAGDVTLASHALAIRSKQR